MFFFGYRRATILFLLATTVVFQVGCSENAENRKDIHKDVVNEARFTKEELLKKRILERMNALISMDWKKAYTFLSPARRKIVPYSVFAKRMSVSAILRKKAEIDKMSCNSDVCDVSLRLTHVYIGGVIDAMQGQENTSTVYEKWVFIGDNWWLVPE